MDSLRGYSSTSPLAARSLAAGRDVVGNEERQDNSEHEEPPQTDLYSSGGDSEELDEDEEREEGERQEEELLQDYPYWENPEAIQTLTALLEHLLPRSRRPEVRYDFLALDAPIPFASSCTHGTVYFSRAMLETLSAESLRFYGAHEMAHTELRHFATRRRRLDDLRRAMPAPPGSPARQRMELAAVLAVRHQEEFEADTLAGQWTDRRAAELALQELHQACLRLCPESLSRPTHPPFPTRVECLLRGVPPDPVEYLWSLIR